MILDVAAVEPSSRAVGAGSSGADCDGPRPRGAPVHRSGRHRAHRHAARRAEGFAAGGPAAGHGPGHAPRRAHHRAPPLPPKGRWRRRPTRASRRDRLSPIEDQDAPAPTSDLSAYDQGVAPDGAPASRSAARHRLRRPRRCAAARLPDRRDLMEGTDLDLFQSFDALLIATPHPLDPSVTFLAARHHLDDGGLRAALSRGRQGDRSGDRLAYRGRAPGRRAPPAPWVAAGDAALARRSDHRPGGPRAGDRPRRPSYRALLMAPHLPAAGVDAGAAPDGAVTPDGGTPGAIDWASMLWRIGAEEGLMPPDGALDGERGRYLQDGERPGDCRRCSTGWRSRRR